VAGKHPESLGKASRPRLLHLCDRFRDLLVCKYLPADRFRRLFRELAARATPTGFGVIDDGLIAHGFQCRYPLWWFVGVSSGGIGKF
jgi:hypothetical protein